MSSDWPATVVAVAFVALVAFMFKEAVDHDFATVWAGAGTIVGVVVGAIPSFFFKRQTDKAQQNAQTALPAADPDKVEELVRKNPGRTIFRGIPGEWRLFAVSSADASH